MDAMIATLKPGREVTISAGNGFRVFAERSGDGKTLRIVRESANGFQVISKSKW